MENAAKCAWSNQPFAAVVCLFFPFRCFNHLQPMAQTLIRFKMLNLANRSSPSVVKLEKLNIMIDWMFNGYLMTI